MLTIGLDVGTQGTKCIVYDVDSKEIRGRGAVSYGLDSERHGQAEQDPAVWIKACKDAMSQALSGCDRPQVKGIAVSGQQHGLVVLDSENNVIRPAKLWCDLESAEEAQELSTRFKTTIVPSFTITKILWLKRNEPENYGRIAKVLLPHDYINFWLTGGNFTMEASDASGTGIFDPVHRCWDMERINSVDPAILKWLPEQILEPDASAGFLSDDIAEELDLLINKQVIVGPGGGDNAMSALGVGAVEQGVWVLSLGTSGTLFGPTKNPILDDSGTICAFCDATGQALPLLCTINCTAVTEEVKNLCGKGLDHAELAELASKEPPGCHGVTFLPYLGGERTPNWPHATGALLGIQPGLMRPGVLYRAAMEGATFSLLQGLKEMKKKAAGSSEGGEGGEIENEKILQATELRIVGGGSKNHTWRQLIADAFQLPLRFPVEPETGALGAALQAAAVVTGTSVADFIKSPRGQPQLENEILQPNSDNKNAYSETFERFTRLGVALFGPNGVLGASSSSSSS